MHNRTLIALLFTLLASHVSYASSESLYSSLNVEEVTEPAPRTELKYHKSVGGLTCQKTDSLIRGVTFKCALDLDAIDSSAIYEALDIEATDLPVERIARLLQKRVDELSCTKRTAIHQKPIYHCTLSF